MASAVSSSHNHLSFPNTSSSIQSTPMVSSHVTPATCARVTPVTSSHATPFSSPVHGQYTVTPNSAHPSPDTLPSHGMYTVTKNSHSQTSNSDSALFLGQNLPQASVSHSYSHLQARTLPEATSETVLVGNLSTPTQHISSPRYSGSSQAGSNGSVTLAASPSPRSSRRIGKVPPPQIVLSQQERTSQHIERTLL